MKRKPIEKKSNDCFSQQLCPFEKETEEMELYCEGLCENCKYCPVTCGHWPDGIFHTVDIDGEHTGGCHYFEPNENFIHNLLFGDIATALNFSHSIHKPSEVILEDIIRMINERGPVHCLSTEEKYEEFIQLKTEGNCPETPEFSCHCENPENCKSHYEDWNLDFEPMHFCLDPDNMSRRCISPGLNQNYRGNEENEQENPVN